MRPIVAAFVLVLTIVLGHLGGGPARAEPDFTNVTDILGGPRHLLRADDLVFGGPGKDHLRTGVLPSKALAATPSAGELCGAYPDPLLVRTGRVFELVNDVVVRIAPLTSGDGQCPGNDLGLYVFNPPNGASTVTPLTGLRDKHVQIALGDFNGDGFDDVVVFDNVDGVRVYTAVNPKDPAGGLHLVQAASLLDLRPADFDLWSDPVVGDFNGDGALEVAWVSTGSTVFFASVCPAKDAKVLGQTCSEPFQAIRAPHTISTGGIKRAFLTAGDYDGVPSSTGRPAHELLVVRQYLDTREVTHFLIHDMAAVSFDKDLVPKQAPGGLAFGFADATYPYNVEPPQPVVTSGRLRWNGKTDQVVFGRGWPTNKLAVITFDHDLGMTLHERKFDQFDVPYLKGNDNPFICFDYVGLAAGRYDPPDNSGNTNPNLQVALFVRHFGQQGGTCDLPRDAVVSGGDVAIFTVGLTPDFALELADVPNDGLNGGKSFTGYVVAGGTAVGNLLVTAPASNILWAGDAQGRSLYLGPPTKVTIEHHAQPYVILAAPPMHVDFISPDRDGTSPPTLFNVSAVPKTFYTQYQATDTNRNQSSDKHSTSWSKGVSEQVGLKVTLGSPEEGGFFQQKLNFSAQQKWAGDTQDLNESYTSNSFDISQRTGFDDQVLYTDSRFNLYIYPVVGQQACADNAQNECREDQKRPLFIQVSGSDQIQHFNISGTALEWYQPPWEPGNVFSYPASEAQLKDIYPDIDFVSGQGANANTWFTDQAALIETTSWASGSGTSRSLGSQQTFSEDISSSTTGGYTAPGLASFTAKFTISGAFSNSTAALNTQQTSVGTSTGIGVNKPGTFRDLLTYQYAVTPYIFGQTPPRGHVNQQADPPTDVKTFGSLRTAFLADPTNHGGTWWDVYKKFPDVALNHPGRWVIEPKPLANRDESCLPGESETTVQCASLNKPKPDDLWHSPFYYLRGFFVTNQITDEIPKDPKDRVLGKGPQLQTATAGDKLLLQVRVYNYSQAPVPKDAVVHVRFYGQPWKTRDESSPDGPSFLIGEDTFGAASLPPFRSTVDGPQHAPLNWVLAATSFDTTNHGGRYLTFWVIVWMQKPDGTLVEETPQHGLNNTNAPPGELHSLKDAHDISCGTNDACYSNNVGFYKFPFYVFSERTSTALGSPALPGSVRLGPVQLSPGQVVRGEDVKVSTDVLVSGDAVPGATVKFYDGDPNDGGKLFDVERVAHILANDSHHVSVLFRPDTCGLHRIFAVVNAGTASDQVSQSDLFLNCRRR